jgi:hypothetical protein
MIENADIAPGAITEPKLSKNFRLNLTNVEKGADGQIPVVQSDGSMAYKSVGGDATLDSSGNFTVTTSTSSTGETTQGATGATGPAGATGATGAQGATGAAGSDANVTAENVDGALGFTGSTAGLVKRTADNTFALDTATYSTTGHTHDDRYYTETEADTLLATKSGTGHTHDDRYYTETESDTLLATKSGTGHNHDDRYYTETEADTLLATKSGTGHTHDDRYYTETEADTLLATKSATTHTHDGRYYTETETDTLLATKSGTGHTHDDRYYTETEADTLLATKAASSHTHDDRYYTETEADTLLATKAATSHTHDDRYYTETEADTLLATKAASSHTHDDRYYQESEFLNASAGAGDAGKPVKLDAGGHIDSTMINDGDISFVDLDDLPSTFAPSSHNHAATDITSGTLDTARLDVGASSGKVAAGDHTHAAGTTSAAGFISTTDKTKLDACLEVDDSSSASTKTWSAAKIASNALAVMGLSHLHPVDKFTLEFVWGTDETGLVFSGSGASEYGTLTHDLGTKDIVVSVRSVYDDDDSGNNTNYQEDELADVGYDPFVIFANGANTCKIMQVDSSDPAGTWAITVIG